MATQDNPLTLPPRSPLQPQQYTSTSDHIPSLEYEFPLSDPSRFPISSIRNGEPHSSSAIPPAHPPEPIYPRHDPLHILSKQSQPQSHPPPRVCNYIAPAPSVAPGVLADGVLTAKLPSVRRFIEAATIAPPECPPFPTDKRVLALVALSVFYHPLHPAHWVFWNREQKRHTAHMVQSVLDTTPTPILSPIGWIDVQDNLWILRYTQSAYASRLAKLPWYATYTPEEPENRMSLRKRKPKSTATRRSGDETADEDGEKVSPPPRKRARTRKSTASRSRAQAKSPASATPPTEENQQAGESAASEVVQAPFLLAPDGAPTLAKAAKLELIESPDATVSAILEDDSVPQDVEQAQAPRKSLRQRERRERAASAASAPSIASTLTPSVRARALSQSRTSRASSAVTPDSLGGGESGSSTAVSLCEEEGAKSKAIKTVEEEVAEEAADEDIEGPPAKKPRLSRPRAKSGSRARTATKNKVTAVTDEPQRNTTAQARPKARSRAKTRRR